MATTLILVILVQRIFLFWLLNLGLVFSAGGPPVLARIKDKPPALAPGPNPEFRAIQALPREGANCRTSLTLEGSPTPTDLSRSPCQSERKKEHSLYVIPTPKRSPTCTRDSKEPTNSHMTSVDRDQKLESMMDPDVGSSSRLDYSPTTPQSMSKVSESHVVEHKQEETGSSIPHPVFSRYSPRPSKEGRESHWLKVCRNRHKLKLQLQASPSQAKSLSSSESIISYWSNLAKSERKTKAHQEELSRKNTESKLLIGRDEKLKSIQDPDVGPSNRLNSSLSSLEPRIQLSGGDVLDRKQKGLCSVTDGTSLDVRRQKYEQSSKNLLEIVEQRSCSKVPVDMIQSQDSAVISGILPKMDRVSSSKNSSSPETSDPSTLPISEQRAIARMRWRKAATKVKALHAWGFLKKGTDFLDRAAEKGDVYIFKIGEFCERVEDTLEKINDAFQQWFEIESISEVLQMYMNSRDHNQLDPFGVNNW